MVIDITADGKVGFVEIGKINENKISIKTTSLQQASPVFIKTN